MEAVKLMQKDIPLEQKEALWIYYTNDEGKTRWKCSNCGKVCKKNPYYKIFCSHCGYEMRMES